MSVDLSALAILAATEAAAFGRYQCTVRAHMEATKDEPRPGIKRMTWEPPTADPIVERIPVHERREGLSVEYLRLKSGATVWRATVRVTGFDT